MKGFLSLLLPLLLLLSPALFNLHQKAKALPLSTDGRWIVNEKGHRVKLACVSWPSHVDAIVAEGLSKQPRDFIAKKIGEYGFNCVRFTYPIYLAANDTIAYTTVRQSLVNLGLIESAAAIEVQNPDLIDLPLIKAFQAVVKTLGENNIMVILDNHVSKPEWCCANDDGNGFFGDQYFDPDQWIEGLTRMATIFNCSANVVGMSLRNELRGPNQNVTEWYRYMQRGAEAVHAANPNVLVILSGLNFDNDLSFLGKQRVQLSFKQKLVFELHWYSFSNPNEWGKGNTNEVCGRIARNVIDRAGFLLLDGFPLFVSEFGIDQRGVNEEDNRYISCALSFLAENDIDWALWTLQGSYYLRQGALGLDESYGVFAYDWSHPRNQTFLDRLSSIQAPFRGPSICESPEYTILYHPFTGKCVLRDASVDELYLGSCSDSEAWTNYTPLDHEELSMKDSIKCVQAHGEGKPAKLGIICGNSPSKWELISETSMLVSTKLENSNITLCLDIGPDGKSIVTNPCLCVNVDASCDAERQWFKMVPSSRKVTNKNAILGRLI